MAKQIAEKETSHILSDELSQEITKNEQQTDIILKKRKRDNEQEAFSKNKITFFNFTPIMWRNNVLKRAISMKSEFKPERKKQRILQQNGELNSSIKYLLIEEQTQFAINMDEMPFKFTNGTIPDGEYVFCLIYNLNSEPQLLCCNDGKHHSYLANGKKVLAAGTIQFEQGELVQVTNNSGHYKPTDSEMLDFIKTLYEESNGSLRIYKSYMTQDPIQYCVAELMQSDFAHAKIGANQKIDSYTGLLVNLHTTGYEIPEVINTDFNRFNAAPNTEAFSL
ncbi:MAG: hypothetical protein HKM04_00845 [Legionellales bacterium]|nr:hypothetical protein [Legionellales bacterium]